MRFCANCHHSRDVHEFGAGSVAPCMAETATDDLCMCEDFEPRSVHWRREDGSTACGAEHVPGEHSHDVICCRRDAELADCQTCRAFAIREGEL